MSARPPPTSSEKTILINKKARFEYHILEILEAGIVLSGSEIKSVRNSGISIEEGYVRPFSDGMYLLGATIRPYSHGHHGAATYDPLRPRKLLLHKRQIDFLRGRVEQKGLTIIPLRVYLKGGRAKIEIALARGKDNPDKREAVKEREAKRELARALKHG
jgi:SsrA-binding protein